MNADKTREDGFVALVGECDPAELWSALGAWATRPAPSSVASEIRLRLAVDAAAHLDPAGRGTVDRSVLRRLYAQMPESEASDGDLILNPNIDKCWEIDGQMLLLHPSSHDRPVRDLRELERAAAIADPVLVSSLGFGISDVLELHIRHSDAVLRLLLPVFDSRRREPSEAEIEAYASSPSLEVLAAACRKPAQAQAALSWATAELPITVATTAFDGNSTPALRVATPVGLRDLPPAVSFDTMTAAGQELLRQAMALDTGVGAAYERAVANEVFVVLEKVADVERLTATRAVIRFDERRLLEVTVAAQLTARELKSAVEAVERKPPNKGTIGLFVVSLPTYNEYLSLGLKHRLLIGTDDLHFILDNGPRPEDLYLFLESVSADRFDRTMAFDTLDQFAVWEQAGEMPHGRANFVTYSAHGCAIEWDRLNATIPEKQSRQFPHRTMRSRAQHAIYARLDDGTEGARLSGQDAAEFLKRSVVPAAEAVVEQLMHRYEREDLIRIGCSQVELIEELRNEAPAGWTQTDIDMAGRASRFLLERTMAESYGGGEETTLLDWQELVAAAEALVDAASLAAVVGHDLERVEVTRSAQGEYEVSSRSPGLLDLDAYGVARAEAVDEGTTLQLRGLPWLPGDSELIIHQNSGSAAWRSALQAFETGFGVSLEAVIHVLAVLGQQPFGFATTEEIVARCSDDWTGATKQLRAAVSFLLLRAENLSDEGVQPWRNQERSHRLVSKPLVEVTDAEICVMPTWIRGCLYTLFRYLSEGRLPTPPSAQTAALQAALSAYRNELTAELEKEVTDVLAGVNMPFKANVKKAAALGLAKLSGEIDHVCAVAGTRTIWVLEEKDPVEDFSIDALRRSLARFDDPNAYFDKLAAKVDDVRRDIANVKAALGVSDRARWKVRGAFTCRRPVPAAFAGGKFAFTTPQGLLGLINPAH